MPSKLLSTQKRTASLVVVILEGHFYVKPSELGHMPGRASSKHIGAVKNDVGWSRGRNIRLKETKQ